MGATEIDSLIRLRNDILAILAEHESSHGVAYEGDERAYVQAIMTVMDAVTENLGARTDECVRLREALGKPTLGDTGDRILAQVAEGTFDVEKEVDRFGRLLKSLLEGHAPGETCLVCFPDGGGMCRLRPEGA